MQVDKEEKKPEATPVKTEAAEKKLARAMEVIGKVARLYKRHGQPPKWVKLNPDRDEDKDAPKWVEDPNPGALFFSRSWKRSIRQAAWRKRPAKRVASMRCSHCGLWFVAPAMFRCKCATPKPLRKETLDS